MEGKAQKGKGQDQAEKAKAEKAKAEKANVGGQLVVLNAYHKTFGSGKSGFFGKVLDPSTGKRYQVVGAVELAD